MAKISIKRIIEDIITFGLSERMRYTTHSNDSVIMTDDTELKRAMSVGKVKFTKL